MRAEGVTARMSFASGPSPTAAIQRIVGTAGHVDHGKSSLVEALTGIDPDRLAEEKARAMTIELGFAWKLAADGSRLSFIDVPGHERFIKQMLAGVGGIDAVILVIAADEGPMPQTREHLAIIDLLGISSGVVALTKSDLVDDEWRELVMSEIRVALDGSTLAVAPIIPCSVRTGEGLEELESTLLEQLRQAPGRFDRGRPRLSVDRAFTLTGFGTVVTGTLIDGSLRTGQEIELLPSGIRTRIRVLHVHGARVEEAPPGTRVAVNLAGIPLEQVHRGDLLAIPGQFTPGHRLDLRLHLLASAPASLRQNDPVDLFAGAAETGAYVSLLDREELAPGERGWVQLRTRRPVALAAGDRVIIRRASPSDTIGGGTVIDPAPARHRRFDPEVLARLASRERGDPEEIALRALTNDVLRVSTLSTQIGSNSDSVLVSLAERGLVMPIGDGWITSREHWQALQSRAVEKVSTFHAEQPRRRGIPRDELRARLGLREPVVFDRMIEALSEAGRLADDQRTLRLPTFEIALGSAERDAAGRWLEAISNAPFSPPPPETFGIAPETVQALLERDELVHIAEQIYLTPGALRKIETDVLRIIDDEGAITLARCRDHFSTSRKYAQAILEYLDRRRVTRRVGDDRVRFR
jgi:selenocysteine-specific elongation factor